jgi:hypothetical protein
MLEIQSRPGISPSGLQALSHWADLEERAASRLLQERLNLININREMGNRGVVERLLGREDVWQNPNALVKPGGVDPINVTLSNLEKIDATRNMLAGVNDMTRGQKSKMVKGPDGRMYETIDMTSKPTPDVEPWRAKQAQGQGALDVLLALKQGGAEKTKDLVSQVANINNYGADPQNKYGAKVNSAIDQSKGIVKDYKGYVDKYNASPSRQKQFLEEQTADEMKDEIIKGFYEAMNYTKDPNEKAKIYARTKSALHGIDVGYKRREGSGDLLGPLSDYTKVPGGGGRVGTREVEVTFADGETLKFPVRKNLPEGKSLEKYVTEQFPEVKGRKITRTQLISASRQLDPGEIAESMNKVQELIDKIDNENLSDTARFRKKAKIAQQFGYTLNMESEKLNPLTDEDYAVRGSSKSTFADKVKDILGSN